ncbi:MAG: hypothetical protein ACRDYY_12700 [Acidimicrobiales bacterium]
MGDAGVSALAQIQPFRHDSLTNPQFSITLDATRPGQLLVATAGHPASPGAANCRHV